VQITPLVDVVFLPLIFSLLESTSIRRSMDVNLPPARFAESAPSLGVAISLPTDGTIRVDRRPVSPDELAGLLRARRRRARSSC
jgi:biopolymer transport protein ExbD